MGADSKIEWCQHTFNPFIGCTKVSPACDHCYAESWAKRSGAVTWGGDRKRTSVRNWNLPLKWDRQAAESGTRPRVFCASLADVFDNQVPDEWRADLFDLIRRCGNLDFLLLTKRIGNALRLTADARTHDWLAGQRNVWIGATVCNQSEADRDIPKLLEVPARVRFLSIEPMLGPINVGLYLSRTNMHGLRMMPGFRDSLPGVDWVICGGESGPKARPMHPSWVRSLRDQCAAAGVPFLFKQHGEWLATTFCDDGMAMLPSKRTAYVRLDGSTHDGIDGIDFFGGDEEVAWVGKKAAGRLLDGKLHDEYPK